MASSTVENYLKTILHLQRESGATTVGEIARELAVTPGTVTTMMRQLSEHGLVDYAPRRGLKLNSEGEQQALRVVRRHRLIELFLVNVMQLDWSEVHEEAEILEHVISDRLLDRIDEMLGRPTHDPHGDPIPDKDGRIADVSTTSLAEAGEGDFRVVRVSDEDPELLSWLDEKGVGIGHEFVLALPDKAAGLIQVSRESGERFQLGLEVAGKVFVEAVES